jgi:hypothetical protein
LREAVREMKALLREAAGGDVERERAGA